MRLAKSRRAAEREHSGPDSLGAQAISIGAATSIVFNSFTAVDANLSETFIEALFAVAGSIV